MRAVCSAWLPEPASSRCVVVVLAGVEDDLVRPVSQREREGSRLYELGAVADDRKDSHSDRESRRPMPLKILLAGAPLLARGVMTGKTLVWYVNWRLERV
jgi:hypothetical protein